MNKITIILLFATALLVGSCAHVYHSPDANSKAGSHRIIAIAPPQVSIAAIKKVDPEALKEQQRTESTNFQKEMYAWLLRRKQQNRITVEIQDVETTTAKLKKAGYFDGTPMSPNEICTALDVDAIMTSNYSLSKPMSEAGAIALGLLVGVWGSTNETAVTLSIHDKESKKMLWNYNRRLSGTVGSTPSQLVDNLMRHASRKMPYYK